MTTEDAREVFDTNKAYQMIPSLYSVLRPFSITGDNQIYISSRIMSWS